MVIFVTWLGNLGTIKASILPPYIYAVNHFFKDYGRDQFALGAMVAWVRKSLAASHGILSTTLITVPLPTRVVIVSVLRAEDVRLELH
jgi:hypothetical protein